MEGILYIVFEFVFVFIFQYPGAFIRWIFLRKKRSFENILKEDAWANSGFAIVFILMIIGLVSILISL